MPDMDRADQILAIGRTLSRIPMDPEGRRYYQTPAPIIGMWATELHDKYGMRVHPELAKEELVRVESPAGNHGPVRSVTRNTPAPMTGGPSVKHMQDARTALLAWLQEKDPDLHRRVVAAENDPMKSNLLLAEIHREHPDVIAKGEELVATYVAESSGP
ncbi:hypothetical protein ORI20_14110 [Mycobacterium sp. CVI_P3]|uniref:Uncharacterized protein n=1 Tax=Mycobacterium pinniadriaticum TaxID=2994102 RepID=A0ABT3SFD9_9MYCO|nr:hypothetical protein [Mycobacterium pinniadriaticum]MCX2931415.1 hypothetical protein [Mycobacterium pinniadriaticum]MCX2937839.1 hypothetical protein [Mycobacterium pinniadriaticum]